jgi:hypothetical protein
MTRIFQILLLATVFLSCKTSTKPCDWQEYEAKARVQSIEQFVENGDTLYSIGLKFNSSSLKEEIQYLEKLQNVRITKETMKRNSISLGLKYGFIVNDALNGNCKTPVVSFQHNLR